jgi:type IV secretory pathway TrbL component
MMRGKVVGLVAAAALLASVGIANAKGPVKLTDAQLDKVTAAGAYTAANLAATVAANVGTTIAAVDTAVAANVAASAAINSLSLNTTAAAFATAGAALTP